MSADRLDEVFRAAVSARVLSPSARKPVLDTRPWPVVLLTALGAWLAAIPLLGVVALLLVEIITRGVGPYVAGVLMLALAVVVLRSRNLPLFVEQLAVPILLVGGGSLGGGLFRDLPTQTAAVSLALVAVALAIALPRAWLRVLLGAAAAGLITVASLPDRWQNIDRHGISGLWLGVHTTLAVWVFMQWLLHDVFESGARARLASAVESLAAGWLLATLAALTWWSGMTFLIGGSLGAGLGEVAAEFSARRTAGWQAIALPIVSVALAMGAAFWTGYRWPAVRKPWCAGAAVVLVVLAWFLPAFGAVLLAWSWCATTSRWRLASAATVSAVWIIGTFYYQLQWSLGAKAAVLATAGAALGALSWVGTRNAAAPDAPAGDPERHDISPMAARIGIGVSALAVLAVSVVGIWQREALIAQGHPIYVELAPVDPRSLMQGDYMRLNFRVPPDVSTGLENLVTRQRPMVVADLDARGVATLRHIDTGTPLAPGQLRIELTPKGGRWILVSDAWYFKEGDAQRWSAAKYGEFRVSGDGEALLVGMADAQLQPIKP